MSTDRSCSGVFNYIDPTVEPSLYRNGRVRVSRDSDGNDYDTQGVHVDERQVTVHDARLAEKKTLAESGFQLIDDPFRQTDLDFFDHARVTRVYYEECSRLIAEATGAERVYAFDHNIRSAAGKQEKRGVLGGQQVQNPLHLVHNDYTLTSAPERIQRLARPPSGNDTLRTILEPGRSLLPPEMAKRALEDRGRFAIINVWRNITDQPVATHPLALCEGASLSVEDLVVLEIHYADRIGENYLAKHSPQHRWYFFPAMTRDEALLIKQWDSAGELARKDSSGADAPEAPCTFSLHSAFEDPATPEGAPDRWSIEVRCAVLY